MAHDHRTSARHAGAASTTPAATPRAASKIYYHLTLLAETTQGYRNLIQLSEPGLPRGLLLQAPGRLGAARARTTRASSPPPAASAATCCSRSCSGDDERRARARPARLQDIFGRDNLFVELQDHGLARAAPDQPAAARDRPQARRAAARHQRQPLHPPRRRTRPTTRCCACRPARCMSDPKRFKFDGDEHYLKTARRDAPPVPRGARGVRQHAAGSPSGPTSRSSSASRSCPTFPLPEGFDDDAATSRDLTLRGRAGALGRRRCPHEVVERLELRARGHRDMGFARTSSIVWDLDPLRHATAASASARAGGARPAARVAYCLRITDLDPIKYDLLFERFLNPGRITMPDIDMDFDSRYRDEMIRYAAEQLRPRPRRPDHHVLHDQGPGRGARRRPRARLPVRRRRQDRQGSCRRWSWAATRRCTPASSRTRSTPTATRWPPSCARCTTPTPTPSGSIDVAQGLEGLRRQDGIHAAAVVITKEPLTEYLPIQRKPEAGQDARGRAGRHPVRDARRRGARPAEDGLPRPAQPRRHHDTRRPDPSAPRIPTSTSTPSRSTTTKTFDLLRPRRHDRRVPARGRRRCARCCARWRPTTFEDVAALVALYRPGPMAPNMHNDYADRKNGRKPVELLPPRPRGGPRPTPTG